MINLTINFQIVMKDLSEANVLAEELSKYVAGKMVTPEEGQTVPFGMSQVAAFEPRVYYYKNEEKKEEKQKDESKKASKKKTSKKAGSKANRKATKKQTDSSDASRKKHVRKTKKA